MKFIIKCKIWFLASILIITTFSCHNIMSYESIPNCVIRPQSELVRSHNNLIGLVRLDVQNNRFFIQARLTGDDDFSLLEVCNLPTSYREADKEIRFFGNQFEKISEEEDIIPFEITFIETFSRR